MWSQIHGGDGAPGASGFPGWRPCPNGKEPAPCDKGCLPAPDPRWGQGAVLVCECVMDGGGPCRQCITHFKHRPSGEGLFLRFE